MDAFGQGLGTEQVLPDAEIGADVSVSYHDLNGDGYVDALLSDENGRLKVRLGDSAGSFGDIEPLRGPLTKTSGMNGWDAVAHSFESFVGSGRLTLTTPNERSHRVVGLSNEPGSGPVTYAFHIWSNGLLGIAEDGEELGQFGTHHYGDELNIVRDENGVVSYIQNGEVLYTSSVIADGRIWTHLGNSNGGFDPIRALGTGLQTRLTKMFDRTASGVNLARWSGGAHAFEQLEGAGSLSVVATETDKGRLIGLSTEVSEREFLTAVLSTPEMGWNSIRVQLFLIWQSLFSLKVHLRNLVEQLGMYS